jgi:hypothetical protein
MSPTDEILAAMRCEIRPLLDAVMEGILTKARVFLDIAAEGHAEAWIEVAKERAQGLTEVATEHAKGLAEIDMRWAEFHSEVAAMRTHKEKQQGRVVLNIGGYRFETSVQTLQRIPHTFFDAYFSGRYAQDVCADGSIFVDRDGAHFGHVLEYMRDGCVSWAEPGAHPGVELLRALKREFGFYCIELVDERPNVAFVMGGQHDDDSTLSSMSRYDASSEQWSVASPMATRRSSFSACSMEGELYVVGGLGVTDLISGFREDLISVEKYSPSSDTWSSVASLPAGRCEHTAIVVRSAMYVFGGCKTGSTLKYDSTRDTWSEVAPMPEVRDRAAACAIGNAIYVFGGARPGSPANTGSVFMYDTEANHWSRLPPMPLPCSNHSVSILGGLVYVVANIGVLRFNPASGEWKTLAPTLIGHAEGCSFVANGCLFAAGGEDFSMERYDVATNVWTAMTEALFPRWYSFCAVAMRLGEEENLFDALITNACKFKQAE